MTLAEWVRSQKPGAITRLHMQTGLSYSAVHAIVSGKSRPSAETAVLLSEATRRAVTIDAIYYGRPRTRRKRGASTLPPSAAAISTDADKTTPRSGRAARRERRQQQCSSEVK